MLEHKQYWEFGGYSTVRKGYIRQHTERVLWGAVCTKSRTSRSQRRVVIHIVHSYYVYDGNVLPPTSVARVLR